MCCILSVRPLLVPRTLKHKSKKKYNNLLLADLSMFGKFCHLVEAAASTMLGEMNAASTMLGEVKELQWYPLDEPDSSAAYVDK